MIFAFAAYELDEDLYELRRDGERVAVQPKVLSLLFFLVRERARTVLKAEVLEAVWPGIFVGEASLLRAVSEARKAIRDQDQDMIVTVRGRGFRFAPKISVNLAPPRSERSIVPPQTSPEVVGRLVVVGREPCLAVLRAVLAEAAAKRAGAIWISGEGGVGKTFVLEAFAQEAKSSGATVVWARSHAGGAVPAYWSWTQFARSLGDAGAAVEKHVDELRAIPTSQPSLFSHYDSMARALTAASANAPLVLAIDDLDLADEPSVAALGFFVREMKTASVLVVGTLRDASRLPNDASSLRALLRDHASHAVSLRSFDQDEIAAVIAAESKAVPPSGLVEAVWEKSGGNPLLVRALLDSEWARRALREAEVQTLSSLELRVGLLQSIEEQIALVSSPCLETLVVASFLGLAFSVAALTLSSGLSGAHIAGSLDEALAAKLVVRAGRGKLRFANALVREVLYKRVPAADRPLRHQALGRALLAAYGDAADAHAGELSVQFLGAAAIGEAELARAFSLRAAASASREGDHAAAAKRCADAIEALSYLPSATTERLEAQLALGTALAAGGSTSRAAAAFLDAAALARAFGRDEASVVAALGYVNAAPADSLLAPDMLQEAKEAAARIQGSGGDEARRSVAEVFARFVSATRESGA